MRRRKVLYNVDLSRRNKPLDAIRFQSSAETFKIKPLTKMKRLIDAWCRTPSCVPPTILPALQSDEWRGLLRFTLNGHKVEDDDTSQSLGIEDKAQLIVSSARNSSALTPAEAAPLQLADDIAALVDLEEFHDVWFSVGPAGERIGANRTVLAARTDRFRYLMASSNSPRDSQMEVRSIPTCVTTHHNRPPTKPPLLTFAARAGSQEARTGEVMVPDHNPEAFRAMLRPSARLSL